MTVQPDEITIRRVLPTDRDRAAEMCANTWGGEDDPDYIEYVFETWVNDQKGAFLAAVERGRLVGLAKITLLAPGEVWLEGLRVAEEARGRGIARVLSEAADQVVRDLQPRAVRFVTGDENDISKHLGASGGMRVRGRFVYLMTKTPPPVDVPPTEWPKATWEEALAVLCSDRAPFLAEGFVLRELTETVLQERVKAGEVWVTRTEVGQAVGMAIGGPAPHDGTSYCLGYLKAAPERLVGLSARLWLEARRHGRTHVMGVLPADRTVQDLHRELGCLDPPFPMVLLERIFPAG